MPAIFDKMKSLIYGNAPKYLTPEQARTVSEEVKKALATMRSNCSWAQVEVDAAIEMARTYPAGTPLHQKYRRMLKLRLVMQQYMEKMSLTMETVSSQIELAQMSAEMGKSLQSATNLVGSYKRDMPSFTGYVRSFMKTIAPMNEALDGGLEEMSNALDQLCDCTLDGVYSESDLDALISGEVTTISPTMPMKAPEASPSAPAMSAKAPENDLLASIEAQMGAFHKGNDD